MKIYDPDDPPVPPEARKLVIVANTDDVVQWEALREAVHEVVYANEFEGIHARVVQG